MPDSTRSRLVTFGVALPAATYPAFDQRVQLYHRLIDRFSAMPGIERRGGRVRSSATA